MHAAGLRSRQYCPLRRQTGYRRMASPGLCVAAGHPALRIAPAASLPRPARVTSKHVPLLLDSPTAASRALRSARQLPAGRRESHTARRAGPRSDRHSRGSVPAGRRSFRSRAVGPKLQRAVLGREPFDPDIISPRHDRHCQLHIERFSARVDDRPIRGRPADDRCEQRERHIAGRECGSACDKTRP